MSIYEDKLQFIIGYQNIWVQLNMHPKDVKNVQHSSRGEHSRRSHPQFELNGGTKNTVKQQNIKINGI